MEEDIRKRGLLYLQQQRFGKKWRKVWSILYQESTCSISRLEFFESKDASIGTLEKSKCKQENKKVIKLSDCICVSDVDVDGCPKDCKAFRVETTEKNLVFAVEKTELEDWMQKLCELAFPVRDATCISRFFIGSVDLLQMNWTERGATRKTSIPKSDEVAMSNNTLYCGTETAMKDFRVAVRWTNAAERCGLKGHYLLRTDFDNLLLKEPKTGEVLFTWPYRFLRRFGRDKMTFSFEAGRRCDSGEGSFEFDTKQGNTIFQYVEAAINLQRAGLSQRQTSSGAHEEEPVSQPSRTLPPTEDSTCYSMLTEGTMKDRSKQTSTHHSRLETPADKHLTGVKSLNLDTRPPPRKNQIKNFKSCPLAKIDDVYSRATAPVLDREIPAEQEEQSQSLCPSLKSDDAEYSLPFDNIAKHIMVDIVAASHSPPVVEICPSIEGKANEEPLYDSIDESAIRSHFLHEHKKHLSSSKTFEHIYDEPEGYASTPSGPTSLYDDPEEVRGDAWKILGAVIDPSGHEYPYNAQSDDYAVPKPARRALNPHQERGNEGDSSPYDNVILKMKGSKKN